MRSVMKPLVKLALITREIGRGKLDTEIPSIKKMGEVSMLAESFAMMQLSLKQYIASLETSVRQQERIQSELSIARNIQMGMLPAVFPPFPGKSELSLFASITPANKVSGDFYDYFFMDDARLFFCIGDVSGKGIHAALFMMKVKTLTGMVFSGNIASLHEAAEKINSMLSDDNAQMMFVSIIFGILDTGSGSLAMCNCGHNKPYLLSPGKAPYRLDFSNGLPQGIDKQAVYTSAAAKLEEGESLFLYTDGLTEATNSRDDFFGEERLAEVLMTNASADPEQLCKTIGEKTEAFGLNSPRHDDITMLCIRYNGKKTSIHKNHKE
jgi:sigma-B regulation protein RsbU (phosphoserine phosphatase)